MRASTFFSLFLLLIPSQAQMQLPPTQVELNTHNHVVVRGSITEQVADNFIKDLMLKNPQYVYISSNGGSVMAGNRMITHMANRNLTCIVDRAYSMAFVILQACDVRLILPSATVMQHQQSLGIRGDLMAISAYLDMVHAMEQHLTKMQADKIGMPLDEFQTRTNTDWWLFGQDIIDYGIADSTVGVTCSEELLKSTMTVTQDSFFFIIRSVYSGCPLLNRPLEQEMIEYLHKDMEHNTSKDETFYTHATIEDF